MRSIDIHAHLEPRCFHQALHAGNSWHGMTRKSDEADIDPMETWTPEQRIADMDSLGVDVQVVSTSSGFYKYGLDVATTLAIATDCNNEVHQMTLDHPDRFRPAYFLHIECFLVEISYLTRILCCHCDVPYFVTHDSFLLLWLLISKL